MTGRWWSAPAYVILGVLGFMLALLMIPLATDGSYSCGGSALEEVVHPEPVGTAAFRANFFDAGWVCNHRAVARVEAVATVFGVLVVADATWAILRRRSFVA